MKILIRIDVYGKNDNKRVYKLINLSCLPIHNSILCFPDGPVRRLNDDIDISGIGLNFRVDAKNVWLDTSRDVCVISVEDLTRTEVLLKTLLKEYLESGWSLEND